MKNYFRRLMVGRWYLLGNGFPYEERYLLYNKRLNRYLRCGTNLKRAVRWKRYLNNWIG